MYKRFPILVTSHLIAKGYGYFLHRSIEVKYVSITINQNRKIMKSSKLFSAFLLGAATGALMSPEKGSDLRKKLSKNASNLLDQLQDTIANGKETFADLKEKILSRAASLKDEMSEIKRDVRKEAKAAHRTARKTVRANGSHRSRMTARKKNRRSEHKTAGETNHVTGNANGRT